MAYAPHWLFEFGGPLDGLGDGSFTEVWQCGIRATNLTDIDAMTWMVNAYPSLHGWWVASTKGCSPGAKLAWMKLNHIGADGRYSDPAHPNTYDAPTVSVGGAPTAYYPNDMSAAYSWTTSLLRGPGHTGRIYVPNSWQLQQPWAPRLTTESQAAAVSAAHDLIGIVNGANAGGDLQACVASKVTGTNVAITGVRVGKVLDNQRRRRNKLPESYVGTGV